VSVSHYVSLIESVLLVWLVMARMLKFRSVYNWFIFHSPISAMRKCSSLFFLELAIDMTLLQFRCDLHVYSTDYL
jgi:hypothetical protein